MESSSKKTWHLNSTDNSLQFVVQLHTKRQELLPWSPDRRVSLCAASSAWSEEEETTAPCVTMLPPGRNKPTPVPPDPPGGWGCLHPASSTRLSPPSVVNTSRNSGSDSRPDSRFCACAREFLSLRLCLFICCCAATRSSPSAPSSPAPPCLTGEAGRRGSHRRSAHTHGAGTKRTDKTKQPD